MLEAFREAGNACTRSVISRCKTIHAKLPKRQRVARVVPWHVDGCPLCLRLICSWQRRTKRCGSFLTNLPSPQYPLAVICRTYKGSWPVELLLKAWQSYAKLPAFDTANPPLVEGLLWIAMAAAALKRFLAHMTQRLAEVPMSTRKVAMCAIHV